MIANAHHRLPDLNVHVLFKDQWHLLSVINEKFSRFGLIAKKDYY